MATKWTKWPHESDSNSTAVRGRDEFALFAGERASTDSHQHFIYTYMYTGDLKWFESISGSQMFTKSLWIFFQLCPVFLFDLMTSATDIVMQNLHNQGQWNWFHSLPPGWYACLVKPWEAFFGGGFRHRFFWAIFSLSQPAVQKCLISEAVRWWFKSPKGWTFLENIALERLGHVEKRVTVTGHTRNVKPFVLGGYLWCQISPLFFHPKNNLYEHWITLVSLEMLPPSNSGISADLVQDPWLKM